MLDAIFSLDSIATTKAANAAISTAGLKPPATI
jgi:predicted tellurium resistance membrane protein TerC